MSLLNTHSNSVTCTACCLCKHLDPVYLYSYSIGLYNIYMTNSKNMHLTKRRRVWVMDMEDFWVLWIWGFCGIPTGFSVGMGWMSGLKSSSRGMQPCRLALLDKKTGQWLRPRHPLHDGLVQTRRPPSPSTQRNQHDAEGALGCAGRRNDVTGCSGIDMAPLCASVTSPITAGSR